MTVTIQLDPLASNYREHIPGMDEALDKALGLGLKAEGRWLRASASRGLELKAGAPTIDREAGIIYGYSVITKGPALGHGAEVDATTLEQVMALGNTSKMGIKTRFDHPNASNTSLGTFLGRSKTFRLSGDRVLADLHLNDSAKEAPQGDLHTYVLGLAESDPQAFGASIVFEGTYEEQLNDDGTRKKDAQGNPLPRLTRVTNLLASDVVDDPAANAGGLFSQHDSLAGKVTEFLNRWAEHDLLPRVHALMQPKEDSAMATEVKEITATDIEKARAEGFQSGLQGERERVAGIHKSFAAVWGDKAPASELKVRDGLIELGTSASDAETAFKTRKLTVITEAAPASAGGGAEATHTEKVDLSKLPLEDRCKAEWDSMPELREEFRELKTYIAFERANANGQVKILKK